MMKNIFLTIICLISNNVCLGQGGKTNLSHDIEKILMDSSRKNYTNDSLKKYSFKKLENRFWDNIEDTLLAKVYVDQHYGKAIFEYDSIKMARSHVLYGKITNYKNALLHSDSIIFFTKNSSHKSYPNMGYIKKGDYYYKLGNYTKSLDNYLIANKYANLKGNIDHQLRVKQAIGTLKYTWGSNEEAEIIFKEELDLVRSLPNYKHQEYDTYVDALFNLSISYTFNKKLEPALKLINEGINNTIKKDTIRYYEFVLNSGIALYYKDQLESAKDSLTKVISFHKEINTASCHLYLGKISKKQNRDEEFINHFTKLDALLQSREDILPEFQDIYNTLIEFYRKRGNNKKELKYIKRLLLLDSIIDRNNHYLNLKIIKEYDTPNLLAKKEKIINKLDNANHKSRNVNYILLGLLIISSVFIIVFYRQKYLYKVRFSEMMKANNKSKTLEYDSAKNDSKTSYNLSDNIIDELSKKLEKFESNKDFLKKGITAVQLAKKFKTNAKYLAQVISLTKQKSFKVYLNDLRVEYAVEKLKNDSKFRSYTIKAIAEDSGFNTSESFSKTFLKKYGLSPSYFVKKIKKEITY